MDESIVNVPWSLVWISACSTTLVCYAKSHMNESVLNLPQSLVWTGACSASLMLCKVSYECASWLRKSHVKVCMFPCRNLAPVGGPCRNMAPVGIYRTCATCTFAQCLCSASLIRSCACSDRGLNTCVELPSRSSWKKLYMFREEPDHIHTPNTTCTWKHFTYE